MRWSLNVFVAHAMNSAKPKLIEQSELDRLRVGDRAAFTRLVEQHGPRMLSLARGLLRSEHDAEDALQDAFLSASKAIGSFDGRSQLSTWLHRIIINACLMRWRAAARHPEQSIESLLPTFLPDGHQTHSSKPWKSLETEVAPDSTTSKRVAASYEQLPEAQRTVLYLRDAQGFSTQQTAAALDISEDAVKTRLHRARQALRGLLDASFAQPAQPDQPDQPDQPTTHTHG